MSILNNIGVLKFYNNIKARYITSIISMGGGILKVTFGDNTNTSLNIPNFQGATDTTNGISGIVPAPESGKNNRVLFSDGTWAKVIGIPIGFEFQQFNPHGIPNCLAYLGGLYNRADYPDLWNYISQIPSYLKTETEWQSLSSANGGNVPFYSSGDGSTTFRVPSVKCWVKADTTPGTYLKPGLPNITGTWYAEGMMRDVATPVVSGALYTHTFTAIANSAAGGMNYLLSKGIGLNASKSNAIYGAASTVQPQSVTGTWYVWAKS